MKEKAQNGPTIAACVKNRKYAERIRRKEGFDDMVPRYQSPSGGEPFEPRALSIENSAAEYTMGREAGT